MARRVIPLSEADVKKAKPKDAPYKLFDGGGLFLLVTPNGSKLWRMKYRYNDKEQTLCIGPFPLFSLRDARVKRDEARKVLFEGNDPNAEKRNKKTDETRTLKRVAVEWREEFRERWSENHRERIWTRLENDIFPDLGDKDIDEITAIEVLKVLKRVQGRSLEVAHRVKFTLDKIWRFAVSSGIASVNPIPNLKDAFPPVKNNHHPAPLEPEVIGKILAVMAAYDGSSVVRYALNLAPHVFLRPGELRQGEWSEINWISAQWEIPAERMKMKEPHIVPLSKQAVVLLQELFVVTGNGKYMFPSSRTASRAISDNTLNAALRYMGFDTRQQVCAHGFRAMARTLLDEVLEFPADIIEHQLAHTVRDALGRAYNRTTKIRQRKVMMQKWSDYLEGLITNIKIIDTPKIM